MSGWVKFKFYNVCGDLSSIIQYDDSLDTGGLRELFLNMKCAFYTLPKEEYVMERLGALFDLYSFVYGYSAAHVIDLGIFPECINFYSSRLNDAIDDLTLTLMIVPYKILYISHFHLDHISLVPEICKRRNIRYNKVFIPDIPQEPPELYGTLMVTERIMYLLAEIFVARKYKTAIRELGNCIDDPCSIEFVYRGSHYSFGSLGVYVLWPPKEMHISERKREELRARYRELLEILFKLNKVATEILERYLPEMNYEFKRMFKLLHIIINRERFRSVFAAMKLLSREFPQSKSLLSTLFSAYASGYEILKQEAIKEGLREILLEFERIIIPIKDVVNDTSMCLKFYNKYRVKQQNCVYATHLGDVSDNILDTLDKLSSKEPFYPFQFQTKILKAAHHGSSWGTYQSKLISNADLVYIPWCPCMPKVTLNENILKSEVMSKSYAPGIHLIPKIPYITKIFNL